MQNILTPSRQAGAFAVSRRAELGSYALASADIAFPISHGDFLRALRAALRDYSRPDLLKASPLLRSPLLTNREAAAPADLQSLLAATVDELFANPRDEKLRRIIDLTYFRPVPKQDAAADRLGMAYSTYRRHLTAAIRRIAARLWEREQAASVDLVGPPAVIAAEATRSAAASSCFQSAAPRLSIVVLPFLNLTGDKEQDYFADGITESLTTDLSRLPEAFVIARNTAFSYKDKAFDVRQLGSELGVHYVLEGSVQRSGNRLRINAQLVDAGSGVHLLAERFDRELDDVFEVQDEIVARLARTLDSELISIEARRAERSQRANPDALDLIFRGWAAFNRGHDPGNLREAERFFDQALALDADNASVLAGLALVKFVYAATYATGEREAYLSAAEEAATSALAIAPDDARAQGALALVYMATNRAALGIAAAERSIALDQNMATSYAFIAWAKPMLGQAGEAKANIAQAFRLSPKDSYAYVWHHIAGVAELADGHDEEAVTSFRSSIEANRMYPMSRFMLAAALALQGERYAARQEAAAGLAAVPDFTVSRYRDGATSDNPAYLQYRERIHDGLRMAGIPN